MRLGLLFVFSILLFTPRGAWASLIINEISWQGYLGDANNEWIEIYNDGGETVNLDGWLLEASDGTPSINLSGLSVSAGSFLLLERTDDTTVPEETASLFYSGALSNEGENLILKNSSGSVIDSANFSSGWNDMQSSSVGTMSRFGSVWREGEATPKAMNTALESDENNNEDDSNEDGDEENNNEENEENDQEKDKEVKGKPILKEPKGNIESQNQSFVGIPVPFNSFLTDIDSDEIRRGIYVWNMGDGSVLYKTKKESFEYTYQYPGEYVVSLSFNKLDFGKDVLDIDPYIYDEHIITITDNSITIEDFKYDGTIVLKNNASHSLNLSGWVLQNSDTKFTIPKHTMVRPGKTITFSGSVTKLGYKPVSVLNPSGSFVGYGEKTKQEEVVSSLEKSSSEKDGVLSANIAPEVLGVSSDNLEDSETTMLSFSEQRTMYIGLFALLIILVGIIIWLLFSASNTKEDTVVEYRIIEE